MAKNLDIEFQATYEDSFMESFNNDKQAAEYYIRASINDAMNHFKDETLGTKIDLQLISEPKREGADSYWSGIRAAATGQDIDMFANYLVEKQSSLLNKATHVLFTGDNGDGVAGIANLDTVCKPYNHPKDHTSGQYYEPSIAIVERNDNRPNDTIGWLVAHELGHNLGMQHSWAWEDNFQYVPKGYCTRENTGGIGIMRNLQRNGRHTWNSCNRCDLLKSYQQYMLKYDKYCLLDLNSNN